MPKEDKEEDDRDTEASGIEKAEEEEKRKIALEEAISKGKLMRAQTKEERH